MTQPPADLFTAAANAPTAQELAERLVEALLFAASGPLSEAQLAGRLPPKTSVPAIIARLEAHYRGRGIELRRVAGGWAFRTAEDLAGSLRSSAAQTRKMTRAAVEALAIIAYHQPVTRAEIEEIRGVALSKGSMDQLLEAGWIKPRGRKPVPGRPMRWGVTDAFLEHFGLAGVEDLPGIEELRAAGLLDRRPGITTIAMRAEEASTSEADTDAEGSESDAETGLLDAIENAEDEGDDS